MRIIPCLAALSLMASTMNAQETYPPLKEKFQPKKSMKNMPLVYSDDFETGKADRWEPTDKTAWTVKDQGGNKLYALIKKKSDFKTPVRSPFNRSLVKDVEVGSFVLDLKLQSTHPDYGHRDLCLFFGYQDDSHLYYVHFGKKTDDHANQIFIVNESDRKKISTKTTPGTDWDDEWHHARIVRDAESGKIDVFFDDMENPVMSAVDKTFTTGRVGVGSFDDTGAFDHIALYGHEAKPAKLGKVSGRVTMNGQPLAGATIQFIPQEGRPSVATTKEDGSYTMQYTSAIEGAMLGTHQVSISKTNEGKELIPPKYNAATALTVDVRAANNEIDFDLRNK